MADASKSVTAADVSNFVKKIFSTAVIWIKIIVGVALALVLLATFVAMFGHSIPYVPKFTGLQEAGIFTACVAYWLK